MPDTLHKTDTKPEGTSVGGVIALIAIVGAIDWVSIRVPQKQIQARADAITQVLQSGALTADIKLSGKQFVLDPRADARELVKLITQVKDETKPLELHLRSRDGKPVCTINVEPKVIAALARRAGIVPQPADALTVQGLANVCGVSADTLKEKVKLTFDDTQFQQQFAAYTGQEKPYTLASHIATQGTVIPQPVRQL